MSKRITLSTLFIAFSLTFTGFAADGKGLGLEQRIKLKWATKNLLKNPESVLYDKFRNICYVANINGQSTEKDGNGFISKLGLNGEIVTLKWITGLNAPKGMGVFQEKLFVTDIDRVVEIDIEKDKIVDEYSSPKAQFLNDISVHASGTVYVSDNIANHIFRLENGILELWLTSTDLKEPNGLYAEEHRLLIGINNAILSADYGTNKVERFIKNTDYVDGLASMGNGRYLVSDFLGKIQMVRQGQKRIKIIDTSAEKIMAADIDFVIEKRLLLVPTFMNNRVMAYEIIDE
ncbi:MAG: gluconolaconase [Candidatus Aminicenantes bacterium]|nr:gluconolaconase [Candidatus Aminicenantes bacterium]